jgi:hypothetical protein
MGVSTRKKEHRMGAWTSNPNHDPWEKFRQMERMQLAQRASGKMGRAIGRVLEGESEEELERIAAKDQRLARAGFVKLKRGERFTYKHIDDLTREDRWARIEAERTTTAWLRGRIEAERIVAAWRENSRDLPDTHTSENPA